MTTYEAASNTTVSALYVGDLTPDITDMMLYNIFTPYGQVVSTKIIRDVHNPSSSCYAYVNFRTRNEAERAIQGVNYTVIDGRPCRVMWSMRDFLKRKFAGANLFVKNIHPELDSKVLYEAFSAFGPVMSCKIAQDEYGSSRGFGFVQFYNEADSEEATTKVNGVDFRGKKLYVAKFVPKGQRNTNNKSDPSKFTNVFVKNFGKDNWTVDDMKENFSKFGEITSCAIQRDSDNNSLGFGFVNFVEPEAASAATTGMNGFALKSGEKLYASRAMKKMERMGYLRKLREEHKNKMRKQYREHNLYVKNFDENFTDERLNEEFSKYGTIRSAQIMRGEDKKSRCFGFVCFSTPEEAAAAINGLNSKVIDGKPLFVSIAQSKDERRKILEQQRPHASGFRQPLNFTPFPYVYPQPPMMPMPAPQYAQQQFRPHPGNMRPTGRGMPPQQYSGQGARYGGYNYQSNGSQYYRARNPQNNQFSGGRQDRFQGQQAAPRPHNPVSNQHMAAPQTVTALPPAGTQQPKVKREEKGAQKVSEASSKGEFEEHIYSLCQDVFASSQFDTSKLKQVCGVVISYVNNKQETFADADAEIRNLVVQCYNRVCSQK